MKRSGYKIKRIIPAVLALLMLAACGTDEPVATATPEPAPETTPVPATGTPEPSPGGVQSVSVDFHLPDAGFEPDAYWLADGFGDGGRALMLTAAGAQGGTSFRCWYSVYDDVSSGGRTERDLICGSFSEDGFTGGGFERDNGGLTAGVEISGGALTVSYSVPGDYPPLPESFRSVTADEALEAYRDMPYMGEAGLPVALETTREELEALPGFVRSAGGTYEYDGMELYIGYEFFDGSLTVSGVASTDPDRIPDLRGVKIGSSAADVLDCFPGDVSSLPDGPGGEELTLYGTDGMLSAGGAIVYDGDVPCLVLVETDSAVTFRFDAGGLVAGIVWYARP